ncbi:hypothetical protein GQ457_09G012100 [Hibiscus cannabinus]
MDDRVPHIQGQTSQGVTLQQEISSLRTSINRFESRLDDKFNAFQAKFLADAKLLLEKAFGKSLDFLVAISQSCEESDESSLVTDFAEPTVQVSTMEASTVVEFSDNLLEQPLVQGVGVVSTELAAMEHEQLLMDSNEVKVFDELPVITDVELDNFDYSISGLLEVPHDKGFDILDIVLLEQSSIHDIWLDTLMAMKVIGLGETNMLDESELEDTFSANHLEPLGASKNLRHTTTIVKKYHPLGVFESIATLVVAQNSHKEIIVCEDTDQVCSGMEIAATACVSLQISHIMGNALEEEFYEQEEPWSLEEFSYLIVILRQVSWQLLRVNSSAHLSFGNRAPTLPLMLRHTSRIL